MADFADLQVQLKILSDAYAAQLPEKLQQVAEAWRRLPRSEWDEEAFQAMHRMVHNLSGSGKTFGFALLSNVARNLEEYLGEFARAKVAPNEEQQQRIQVMLNELLQVDISRVDKSGLGSKAETGQ